MSGLAEYAHMGVPTFFRCCCLTARSGGNSGYASAGWHLTNSLGGLVDTDPLEALEERLLRDERDAVWNWFHELLPRCAALVPARRRQNFLDGVFRCFKERGF